MDRVQITETLPIIQPTDFLTSFGSKLFASFSADPWNQTAQNLWLPTQTWLLEKPPCVFWCFRPVARCRLNPPCISVLLPVARWTHPVFWFPGARKEGAAGFFKGIGKGLVGVVARPTGGIVDMASSTFQGIQRWGLAAHDAFPLGTSCGRLNAVAVSLIFTFSAFVFCLLWLLGFLFLLGCEYSTWTVGAVLCPWLLLNQVAVWLDDGAEL